MSRLSNAIFHSLKSGDIIIDNDRKTLLSVQKIGYNIAYCQIQNGQLYFIRREHIWKIEMRTEELCKNCLTKMVCKKYDSALICYERRKMWV